MRRFEEYNLRRNLNNAEIIALDQDSPGVPGMIILNKDCRLVLSMSFRTMEYCDKIERYPIVRTQRGYGIVVAKVLHYSKSLSQRFHILRRV